MLRISVEDQCVVTYPQHLGAAHQNVQDPVAEVFSPRVLSLVMSLEGTMVLNIELFSMNSILMKVVFLSRWERAVWSAIEIEAVCEL